MASVSALNPVERRASFSLASIFALRMLGLFMIYPVFSLYTHDLPGATPFTIGVALGIYGLSQALLQLPFGIWSDRVGRRRVISIGLLLFAVGSVVAALSHTIWGIIIGRALQGTGAIGAVMLAMVADLTREEQRTKAMAFIGMSIGMSFALAMVLGPVFNRWVHIEGIFWLTALMALAGLAILYFLVPAAPPQKLHRDTEAVPTLLWEVLKNRQLLRLDFGIFAQHAILTATFLGLPQLLQQEGNVVGHQWLLYLLVLAASVVLMVPLIIYGERKAQLKRIFLAAIAVTGVAQLLLAAGVHSLWLLVPVMILFFTAFNLLESTLPSLISRLAPAGMKGTAMGVYSSSQFLGIFVGGVVGGFIQQHWHYEAVFLFAAVLALLWLLASLGLRNPGHVSTRTFALGTLSGQPTEQTLKQLRAIPGVLDVALALEDGSAILKVDNRKFDEAGLGALLAGA